MSNLFRLFTVWDTARLVVYEGLSIKEAYEISRWYWNKPYILWMIRLNFQN